MTARKRCLAAMRYFVFMYPSEIIKENLTKKGSLF